MTCTVIAVDFTTGKIVGNQCIPKQSEWMCDCCGNTFIKIEGSDSNVGCVQFDKETKTATGKVARTTTITICETCCGQLGQINFNNKGE